MTKTKKVEGKGKWLKGAKYKREIYKGGDGMFYVRVKARNGNIVNTMAEGYQRKGKAEGEFDKLYSVDDLQLARNLAQSAWIAFEGSLGYAKVCVGDVLTVLDRVIGKIDRRKE